MTWVFDGEKGPKRVEIETSTQWQELTPDQKNYAVWIGHATYLINNGDINILTDPIFSKRASPIGFAGPKRMIPAVMSLSDLPKIDLVVVSHNHYDHLDIWSLKKLNQLNPKTIFLVPIGDGKKLTSSGIKNVYEMINLFVFYIREFAIIYFNFNFFTLICSWFTCYLTH